MAALYQIELVSRFGLRKRLLDGPKRDEDQEYHDASKT